MDRGANCFPLLLRSQTNRNLFDTHETTSAEATNAEPNLSEEAKSYLRTLDAEKEFEPLFFHTVAVLHAPAYRAENAGALRQDWPRIPLPASRELLEESAALGRQIAALLNTETSVSGVTSGSIRPALRNLAVIRRADSAGSLDLEAGDLELRAGWGHRGKGNVVMPGKGRLTTRNYTETETGAWQEGGQDLRDTLAALGDLTHDVYLNDAAAWINVPARVWDYTIGGYQVIKKWLSYREFSILERSLTAEEAREVMQIARRIAAILLLEPGLDQNYERVKTHCYNWQE